MSIATNTELDARLDTLETAFIQQEQNTVKVSEMSDAQRLLLYNKIFPEGTILNVASTLATVGSRVEGSGIPGINGGRYWIGIQTQVNPTIEEHISHFIHKALP